MGSRRAQSESIGVILLTAVIIIVIGVGSYAILGGTGDSDTVLASIDHSIDSDRLRLTHTGGDTLAASDLRVVVRGSGTEQSFILDAANLSGSDDQFEPSERIERDISTLSGTVDLYVVHVPTNTALLSVSERIKKFVADSILSWSTGSDWNGATSAVSVVHDGFGDHRDDAVELGHARDSTGGAGRPRRSMSSARTTGA